MVFDHVRLWSTMVLDHGRPWLAMALITPWSTMGGHLTKHGRPWSTMVDHGCMTMDYHGRPWYTTVFHLYLGRDVQLITQNVSTAIHCLLCSQATSFNATVRRSLGPSATKAMLYLVKGKECQLKFNTLLTSLHKVLYISV